MVGRSSETDALVLESAELVRGFTSLLLRLDEPATWSRQELHGGVLLASQVCNARPRELRASQVFPSLALDVDR